MSNRDEHISFSEKYAWCDNEKYPRVNTPYNIVISKVIDGKVLKEKEARVINWPNHSYENEPIEMKWGEVFKAGEEWAKESKEYRMKAFKRRGDKPEFTIGEGIYDYGFIRCALRYLPKKTLLTIQTGERWPMTITFEHKGEDWIVIVHPIIRMCSSKGCNEPEYRQCKVCKVIRCEDCESILPNGIDYYTGLCRECEEVTA